MRHGESPGQIRRYQRVDVLIVGVSGNLGPASPMSAQSVEFCSPAQELESVSGAGEIR
jgi:hypothetical protein